MDGPSYLIPATMPRALTSNHLLIKRKLLRLIGGQFHIHDASSQVEVAIAVQKGFKLKEDIRISFDGVESIGIFARQVFDFSAAYDIVDLTQTPNLKIGVMQRKGWKSSFVRDEWVVLDAYERAIGTMIEDSPVLGIIRRFIELGSLIPQNYDYMIGNQRFADLKQTFNPFAYQLNVKFEVPPEHFDRRLILAAAILLAAIEGRQK